MDDYMKFITFFILFYICSCCCCSKTRISSSRYIIRELSNNSFDSSNSDATETCTDISSNNNV